jgi:hypothetical protein
MTMPRYVFVEPAERHGWTVVPCALLDDPRLSWEAVALAVQLLRCFQEPRLAAPTARSLARQLHQTERRIRQLTAELERAGWLERMRS